MKTMKFIAGLTLLSLSTTLYADTIFVDNKQIPVESEIKQAMNYVPLRFVAEALGATVEWQNPHVIVNKGDTSLQLTINSHDVLINGKKYTIAATPYLSNNYTYVPLRFISEQLGCDVAYTQNRDSENTVHITSTNKKPPSFPEYVDTKEYMASPDGLWGFTQEYIWGDYVATIKNMSTGSTKEIFTSHANFSIDWVNNQLVISALNEGKSRNLMIYSPTTDKLETISPDIYDYPVNVPELNSTFYMTKNKASETQYHIYSIKEKKSEIVTKEKFNELLSLYSPQDRYRDYALSNDGLWAVMIDDLGEKHSVLLENRTTNTRKEIFSSENYCRALWLNENLIIAYDVETSNSSSNNKTTLLYNPKIDKLTTILTNSYHNTCVYDLNAIVYTILEDNETWSYKYFIYDINTKESKSISEEEYEKLQDTYTYSFL